MSSSRDIVRPTSSPQFGEAFSPAKSLSKLHVPHLSSRAQPGVQHHREPSRPDNSFEHAHLHPYHNVKMVQLTEVEDEAFLSQQPGPKENEDDWDTDDDGT